MQVETMIDPGWICDLQNDASVSLDAAEPDCLRVVQLARWR